MKTNKQTKPATEGVAVVVVSTGTSRAMVVAVVAVALLVGQLRILGPVLVVAVIPVVAAPRKSLVLSSFSFPFRTLRLL